MAKSEAKKTEKKTTQDKPNETSSLNIEKLKAIVEKLKDVKRILGRLEFYRKQENEIDAEVDSGNLTQEKANRLKIMIRLQKAKEQHSDRWSEASLEGIRSEISIELVPLEDFIIENSLDGDNELLKKIYETIRDSEESQEIQNLIVDFEMVCQRAEKKSGTQLKEPPEKPPEPETTGDEGGEDSKKSSSEQPKHLITLKVAVAEFKISRSHLMRKIKSGEIKSYRPANAAQTAEHIVDAVEIASRWARRK